MIDEMPTELAGLIARRFAALADPTRVRLLHVMHQADEISVGDLAAQVDGSHANVSKHLGLLLSQGMVERRREGSRALYRIADPALIRICDEVCSGVRDQLNELNAIVAPAGVGR